MEGHVSSHGRCQPQRTTNSEPLCSLSWTNVISSTVALQCSFQATRAEGVKSTDGTDDAAPVNMWSVVKEIEERLMGTSHNLPTSMIMCYHGNSCHFWRKSLLHSLYLSKKN